MNNVDISHLSILIVDKNPLLRTVFRQVLRELGARTVEAVSSVEAGFDAVRNRNPDIILADWGPDCDGLGLLRRIRMDPQSPNPYVPVIVCSANTEAEAVLSARDMGMSEYLAKPVLAKSLYQRIARVVMEQRSFVKTGEFFGPDRRRHEDEADENSRRETETALIASGAVAAPA